jgi:hypothetical protein
MYQAGAGAPSKPENAFGGTGGVELEHTLFSDGPITSIEFIDFRTAAPIHLMSYTATLADDSGNPANPGDPHRGVMAFFLSTSPDATFTNPTVVSATQVKFPYTANYGSNAILITDSTIDLTAQFFRLELLRADDGGPRIRELDGFGTVVPEPAGGLLLPAMLRLLLRRRGKQQAFHAAPSFAALPHSGQRSGVARRS